MGFCAVVASASIQVTLAWLFPVSVPPGSTALSSDGSVMVCESSCMPDGLAMNPSEDVGMAVLPSLFPNRDRFTELIQVIDNNTVGMGGRCYLFTIF